VVSGIVAISKRSLLAAVAGIAAGVTMTGRRALSRGRARSRRREVHAMKIYLAGPLGFSEAGRLFHKDVIVREVTRLGYQPLDPWELTPQSQIDAVTALPYGTERRDAWRKLDHVIGGNNRAAIDRCDLVFAVLDGTDVDSGTASEIGYAFAKGKPILGYRGDLRLSSDNEGTIVNLQVEYFIRESGGTIIGRFADFADALAKIKIP
jgi:nucleoside 2-deoxyribosyltransferase